MTLEDQCCTPDQSKLLKSLGVKQDSIFYRHPDYGEFLMKGRLVTKTGTQYKKIPVAQDRASSSAFTVAELSIMLPDYYPSWRFKRNEQSEDRLWVATVICSPKPEGIDNIHTAHEFDRYAPTQAQALATLLIALLETEAITAEEVNNRLNK